MKYLLAFLILVIAASQAFIDLEWVLSIPGWHLNAPITDFAGAALVATLPWLWFKSDSHPVPPLAAPACAAAFVGVGLFSAGLCAPELPTLGHLGSLKFLVRKPIFMYVAYLVALPWALSHLPRRRVGEGLVVCVTGVALISVSTSLLRIGAGQDLWWMALQGLTPNHKTLAIWMVPWIPMLWLYRRSRPGQVALVLTAIAVILSGSKAAWVTGVFAAAWSTRVGGRPVVARVRLTAAALLLTASLAIGIPTLLQSPAVLSELQARTSMGIRARMVVDAARSRQSLNLRSWQMVQRHPLLGQGPGSSTHVEMVEFPHYRINGVDAHGAVQKVAAETGLLGLAAWGLFTGLGGWMLAGVWRRRPNEDTWGWLGVTAALHLNLITSTETFSMTHWVPLGFAWGMLFHGLCADRPESSP